MWGIKWLEAYPTVGVRRYLDCKICELAEDLSLAMDVIPQDKTVEIVAAGEEHPTLGLLGHAVRKTDVFLGLRPTGYQKQIDGDAFAAALDRFDWLVKISRPSTRPTSRSS